ncbi:MAG: acyltransferase family protein [Cyanobacteria bacterium P01_A01_bin.116]
MQAKTQTPNSQAVLVDATIYMTLIFLGVVLFLHHVNYTIDYLWEVTHRVFNPYTTGFDKLLQKFAVGGFLFLSGYKLSLSKASEPAQLFLINRLKRIYPLYLLAVCVFSVTVYPNLLGTRPLFSNFLVHALCLQSVVPSLFQENFHSIWFVSNLFCCYLLFLGLRPSLGKPSAMAVRLGLSLFSIYLIRQIASLYGIDIFTGYFDAYLLFFAAGMVCSQTKKKLSRIDKKLLIGAAVLSLIALMTFKLTQPETLLFGNVIGGYVLDRSLVLGSALPLHVALLTSFKKFTVAPNIAKLMKSLAAASYCAFLFHRPIWTLLSQLWSGSSYVHSLFILGFGIPLIFVVSYQMQLFYNRNILPVLSKK